MANSEPGPAIVRCCACLTRAWRRKQYGNLDKGKKQAPVVASAADNELTAWSPATEPARASDVQLGDIDLSDDDSNKRHTAGKAGQNKTCQRLKLSPRSPSRVPEQLDRSGKIREATTCDR